MLNPWFAITFQAARLGFEAQNAAALQLMRLVGGTSKTEVRGMVADKIAAPPVVQAAATKVASDGGRRRESVNKVHKKRSRANKRNLPHDANPGSDEIYGRDTSIIGR
jgi:hypothetical protein